MRLGNSLWVIFNWDSYRSREQVKSINPRFWRYTATQFNLSNDDENY